MKPEDRPTWQRLTYVAAGHLSIACGVIGIALPLVPTTPFLLLAAWCYSRGSRRFHDWLLNHRWFGVWIRTYREKRGLSMRWKLLAIASSVLGLVGSLYFFHPRGLPRISAFLVAGSFVIAILRMPTRRDR